MITKLSMIPSWGPHSQEARLDYEFHQLAGIYPLASQLEFESLKSNIQDNGLIHPIVLFEDKILDGRNRYRACRQVGVEPIFEIFTGSFEEAFQYSNSLNSSRRHLTTSQRSLIAARAIIESRNNEGKNLSVKKASTVYGVSEKYIKRSMKLVLGSPVLADQVFSGSMTLAMAENEYYHENREEIMQKQVDKGLIMNTNIGGFDAEEYERYQYLSNQNQHNLILMLMMQEGSLKNSTHQNE